MNKLKEFLQGSLGIFGFVLYLVVYIIVDCAPLVVLPLPLLVSTALFLAMMVLPVVSSVLSLILWPAGLIFMIRQPQDFWSILYYILFAVNVVRLLLAVVPVLAARRSRRA